MDYKTNGTVNYKKWKCNFIKNEIVTYKKLKFKNNVSNTYKNMGNASSTKTTLIHENINKLIEIGKKLKDKNYIVNKNDVISLYKTFYYPRDSLTKLQEMDNNHYHLHRILKNHIHLYNKYNSLNIDEYIYVENTYNLLEKTLYLIGV